MRIVGFRAANTASTQLRIVNWMEAMQRMGHDVEIKGSPYGEQGQIRNTEQALEYFNMAVSGADVIVYGLTVDGKEVATFQAGQAAYGYKLIIDTDDLVTDVPIYNQASSSYHNATGLVRIAEAQYRSCDAVTVSTEPLKGETDKYNSNVVWMPNVVSPETLAGIKFRVKEERHRGDIRIHWGGGGGHWDDLLIVQDALLRVATERQNVKLVFGNFVPGWAMDLPPSQVFLIPMQPFSFYWKVLAWTCVDIGLAPLVDNRFNRSKSHVKYLDYGVTHTASVYSNVESYKTVKDGETGLLAKPDQWYEKIMALVDDGELRENMGKLAHEHVMDEWHMDRWAGRYEQFLNEIVDTPKAIVEELTEGVPIVAHMP